MNNQEYEWDFADTLSDFGVDYNEHTREVIRQLIGEEINFKVLYYLIKHNKNKFSYAAEKGPNYVFGVLKNTITTSYQHEKEMLLTKEQRKYPDDLKQMLEEFFMMFDERMNNTHME